MKRSSTYPDSDEIEPDVARFLFEEHGAILVVEKVPVGTDFGIDMMEFRIGEKFKGIKMIPPGIHFIYAGAADRTSLQSAPRSGFIHDFKSKEILIVRWSVQDEDFDLSSKSSEEDLESYRSNLRDLDQYLGPYKYSTYSAYLKLVNQIKPDIVKNLMPRCNRIRSVPVLVRDTNLNSSDTVPAKRKLYKDLAEDILPHFKPDRETVINFTQIPDNHLDCGQLISSNKVTDYNLDSTMKLEHMFLGETGPGRLLGEFQFAFMVFIFWHNYESFEHWKKLLKLICLVDEGLSKYYEFFEEFITVLRYQMDQVPTDIFEGIVDSDNFVRGFLDIFVQNIERCTEIDDGSDLKRRAIDLKEYLMEKFNWQFDLEKEDEMPVIVET